MKEKPIFLYNNGLAFMENGGQYVIMLPDGRFVGFGSGKNRDGFAGYRPKHEWKHDILGNMTAEDSKMTFHDHQSFIDFDELDNCHFINKRHVKHEPHGKWYLDNCYELYHLFRFITKHHNKNLITLQNGR